ncbi:MAG TPA: GntR family transcriptional regulator, partial [Cytophagaceae bacterium]
KENIVKGVYKEGELLPSENELCASFGITRPTVRLALASLVSEGYISKQQGKGSIVNPRKNGLRILSIQGVSSVVGSDELQTSVLKKPSIIDWPDNFFFGLSNREKTSGAIHFERLRLVKAVPIMFEVTYISNINLPRFTSRSMENKSLFDVLRASYSIEVKGGEQNMWAIPCDKEMSKYLKTKQGTPILSLQRKLFTSKKEINIYSQIYCNTNEFHLHDIF